MPKVTLKSSLSVVYLGSGDEPTATRAVIEETSPGRWVAHAVISPLDLGAFTSEDDAARSVVEALDRLAFRVGEAFAPAVPMSPSDPGEPMPILTPQGVRFTTPAETAALAQAVSPAMSPALGSATIVASHTAVAPADVRPGEPGAVIVRDPLHGAPPVAPSAVGPLGFPVEIVEVKSK